MDHELITKPNNCSIPLSKKLAVKDLGLHLMNLTFFYYPPNTFMKCKNIVKDFIISQSPMGHSHPGFFMDCPTIKFKIEFTYLSSKTQKKAIYTYLRLKPLFVCFFLAFLLRTFRELQMNVKEFCYVLNLVIINMKVQS